MGAPCNAIMDHLRSPYGPPWIAIISHLMPITVHPLAPYGPAMAHHHWLHNGATQRARQHAIFPARTILGDIVGMQE